MRIPVLLFLSASAVGCGRPRPPPPLDPPVPFGDPPEEPQPSARDYEGLGADPEAKRCREQGLEPNRKDRGCIAP